jgi:hypothetical protein
MREQPGVNMPYSGESGAQGLTTWQQAQYAVHRVVGDASQTGAKALAAGVAEIENPVVTYWNLNAAQKQVVLGKLDTINTYTSYLSIAFPPAAVVPCAVGIVSAVLKATDGNMAAAIQDLLGSILVGVIATGKLSDVVTKKLGTGVANAIGKSPSKFVRGLTGDGSTLMPEVRYALAKFAGATDLNAALKAGYKGSLMARGAAMLLKTAISEVFGAIDEKIAQMLVSIGTSIGKTGMSATYQSLKAQVLASVDDIFSATLSSAMGVAESLVPVPAK